MKEREREMKTVHLFMYHFCSFFSFAYFSNSNNVPQKEAQKQRERVSVVERRFFKLKS